MIQAVRHLLVVAAAVRDLRASGMLPFVLALPVLCATIPLIFAFRRSREGVASGRQA